jgi:hypothetical protein
MLTDTSSAGSPSVPCASHREGMDKTWYVRPAFIVMSAFVAWFATAAFYAVVFEY